MFPYTKCIAFSQINILKSVFILSLVCIASIILISFADKSNKDSRSNKQKPSQNYSIFTRRLKMEVSMFEDSFKVLSNVHLNPEELNCIMKYLELPQSKTCYGFNLALNVDIKDTNQRVTYSNVIAATLYHKVFFGLRSKEMLYLKADKGWSVRPQDSELVRYYFSCSQRYWKFKSIDSTQFKSEILLTIPSK